MSGTASPVVVVGAGPVGQTAALLLARWGINVVVLDGRARRDPLGSRAIVQQRDVIDVWDSVGVGRRIADEGVTWRTARTYYRDTELFAMDFVDRGRSPFPPFVNISQSRTEELLDEAIAGETRIEVRWGQRVTAIAQDTDGVTLTVRSEDGREHETPAAYALVCAGPRCDDLRSGLGLTLDGETFADQFLICDIRAELPGWERERRFYFDPAWNPGRQVLVHPCPQGTYRIDWQVTPDFDLGHAEATGALDGRIRQIVGDRPYEVLWRSVYRFQSRVVSRMLAGRVLLAGDAAHLYAPFGARGLNSGVLDVENAAWKLAFVLRGWSPPGLLESYHTERHAAALENLAVTTATMRFLVPGTDEDCRYRLDVLERARTDPAARPLVDSGRLAEPFWYHDSPLTTPNPAHPFHGRPPRGSVHPPAPGVLVPDGLIREDTRLRAVARHGVTLLAGEQIALDETSAPVMSYRADSELSTMLSLGPDDVWVLRPDAHIAAMLHRPSDSDVRSAIARVLGLVA